MGGDREVEIYSVDLLHSFLHCHNIPLFSYQNIWSPGQCPQTFTTLRQSGKDWPYPGVEPGPLTNWVSVLHIHH
jgi:hypothetical protein